ncbi:DUF2306 domain-containing protein [Nocardioides sp.]|uniref:DUF2306 domain-containing protein n=1 Tax=Nocardioides sp. TaxID=35761 RepID=UPI002C6A1699|nr:DUF2306 domain-containing protein [Nocardioides sp.]HSX68325.1 DUF2306 domain-containing protein [Nocardioides sp.]
MTTSAVASHRPRRTASRLRPAAAAALALAIAFYAPMAFTTFFLDPTGDPESARNFQDRVLALLISPSFAYGVGSGHDGHVPVLVRSFAIMWMHSVVGTLTLVAGFLQFSDRIRRHAPWLHRLCGYLFILGSWVVATTAIAYLLRTPDAEVFSGKAFAEILWVLAAGTLLAPTLALAAIVRRDVAAHREYMAWGFAMICSAGLLRVGWIVVGQFSTMTKEQINLTEAAYAGPLLFLGAALYLQRYGGGRLRRQSPMVLPLANRAAVLLGLLGVVILGLVWAGTDWAVEGTPQAWVPGREALVASWVIPLPLTAAYLAWRVRQAERRGQRAGVVAWRTWLNATLVSPLVSVGFLAFALAVHDMPLVEAWWAASIGWSLALFVAGFNHARVTTRWARRSTPSRTATTVPEEVLA